MNGSIGKAASDGAIGCFLKKLLLSDSGSAEKRKPSRRSLKEIGRKKAWWSEDKNFVVGPHETAGILRS